MSDGTPLVIPGEPSSCSSAYGPKDPMKVLPSSGSYGVDTEYNL